MIRFWIGLLILTALPLPMSAQTNFPSTTDFDTTLPDATDGPVLPLRQQHWSGALVIAIFGVFLSAAVIGPIVRTNRSGEEELFIPPPEARQPGTP